MTTYQFRYECESDRVDFQNLLKMLNIKTKAWDIDTFKAKKGQTKLFKFIASTLIDCHVICDTIEEQIEFDGLRIYCDSNMDSYLDNPTEYRRKMYFEMYNIAN